MLKQRIGCLLVCACLFSFHLAAQQPQAAQQSAATVAEPEAPRVVLQTETTASVLRLMKFSGALRDRAGNARSGAVGLTFAFYKEQQGGSPLWLEVHNTQLDEQGRYNVLLGSTKSEGLPLELFSSGEARWLGVQLNLPGEEEQPRVLLVSVPYALKAADAETLGGKPPSAFLLADPVGADPRVRPEAGQEAAKEGPPREGVVGPINGEGTVDSLAKFTGANAIGNAGIVEVSGKVGIGTATPNVKLSLGTDITAQKLALYDGLGDFYGLGVQAGRVVLHTANTERMAITSGGNVGIGTAAPGAKLAVTGAGTGDARFGDPGCGGNYTGIWLNQLTADCSNYNLTSSPGDQTLYVNRPTGAGIEFREGNAAQMVVKPGGKVGIGTAAPNVKLSLGTDITAQKLALYDGLGDFYGLGVQGGRIVVHTANTERMAITSSGNVGIGTAAPSQKFEVNGNVKISGGGNGIIFPDATVQTTAGGGGTASDLNCAAPCVSSAEVDFNFAGSSSKGGIASNADLLDGLDSAAFALTSHNHDATYVNVSGDTMVGTLNLPANGLVVGTNQLVVSGGNVGIGTATPSTTLSLGAAGNPQIGVERNPGGGLNGFALTVRAGGASVGGSNLGGDLILSAGLSTGTEGSNIQLQTATGGAPGDHVPTTKMTILGSGDLGIGTTTPSQKLEVAGNVKISGGGNGLIFPDNTVQTTAGGGGTATDLNCAAPCVSTAELADLNVTSSKLADFSVTSIKLADLSVSTAKIADNSVVTAKILDANVTSAKVDFNFAGSSSKGGIATNADLLDGLNSTAFAVAAHNHDPAYVNVTGDTMSGPLVLPINGLVVGTTQLVVTGDFVGIGTASPTANHLSLSGDAIRTFGMERRTVADSPGGSLYVRAGAATTGATNKDGGTLVLNGGFSTGSAGSQIEFGTATPGASGTTDNFPTTKMIIADDGKVGIGTTTPSSILSLGGDAARTFGMERRTVANAAGFNLTVRAGGVTVGATNATGGTLVLSSGISTGSGASSIFFQTATGGASGTADNSPTTKMTIVGDGTVNMFGDLNVTGTVSKGGGSFRIDHPLDPANKYLSHSFVESPDMMNVYNGNVRLDSSGEAWVELPEWFEALNRDFRYQLTALGAPAPGLYIAQEVSGNRFKIAGGRAGGRVSWQVTGIRKDVYANAYRIKVEEEKPLAQRGSYLHPELFGPPKEKSAEAVPHPMKVAAAEK